MTPQMAAWEPNPSGRGCLTPNPVSLLLSVSSMLDTLRRRSLARGQTADVAALLDYETGSTKWTLLKRL